MKIFKYDVNFYDKNDRLIFSVQLRRPNINEVREFCDFLFGSAKVREKLTGAPREYQSTDDSRLKFVSPVIYQGLQGKTFERYDVMRVYSCDGVVKYLNKKSK